MCKKFTLRRVCLSALSIGVLLGNNIQAETTGCSAAPCLLPALNQSETLFGKIAQLFPQFFASPTPMQTLQIGNDLAHYRFHTYAGGTSGLATYQGGLWYNLGAEWIRYSSLDEGNVQFCNNSCWSSSNSTNTGTNPSNNTETNTNTGGSTGTTTGTTTGGTGTNNSGTNAGTNTGTTNPPAPAFTMNQTISDEAQGTTLAFSGLAMMTGNLEAQSFFPPGKVADYTGFQYLRDNDPDNMGHNTSFLTRIANNVIYILNDAQFNQLKELAVAQQDQINLYGYMRFPLMKAFRRLLENDIPTGSTGLNLNAVKKASRELYLLDGQISYDRAVLYANIIKSLDSTQQAYLAAMKGKGWKSWADITNAQIDSKMKALPQGTSVAVMTYASDLFSWYAGSVEADTYFCPERQGTYFGSFYIKDAPAIGHEGYGINEQLTATAGRALSDTSKGYVTQSQADVMNSLVNIQRNNLYLSSTSNIVKIRTDISTLLRGLLTTTLPSETLKAKVLELSGIYGDLDGENNYNYATIFAQVYKTLTTEQKTKLTALRKSIMSGTYADGTAFDFSVTSTPFLYSAEIKDASVLTPYIGNTNYLFFEP